MNGYGYSLWLVPYNCNEIMRNYNMKHIPHVTICTNLEYIDSTILTHKTFVVNKFSNLEKFPKMYKNDPLNASGFYCEINGIQTFHTPHMSVTYSHESLDDLIPPQSLVCQLFFVDTRSLNFEEWTLKN